MKTENESLVRTRWGGSTRDYGVNYGCSGRGCAMVTTTEGGNPILTKYK